MAAVLHELHRERRQVLARLDAVVVRTSPSPSVKPPAVATPFRVRVPSKVCSGVAAAAGSANASFVTVAVGARARGELGGGEHRAGHRAGAGEGVAGHGGGGGAGAGGGGDAGAAPRAVSAAAARAPHRRSERERRTESPLIRSVWVNASVDARAPIGPRPVRPRSDAREVLPGAPAPGQPAAPSAPNLTVCG